MRMSVLAFCMKRNSTVKMPYKINETNETMKWNRHWNMKGQVKKTPTKMLKASNQQKKNQQLKYK